MTEQYRQSPARPVDPLPTAATPDLRDSRSVGELLGDVTKDVSQLMRQEVELAKAELKQSASRAGQGAGMFVGAAVAGLLFLVFLSVAVWWALGNSIGRGWSGLIVAVVWAVIAGILALVGKSQLAKVKGLPQTADTVGKIPNALKGNEEDNR
jgi:hypothetical protein